MEWFYQLPGVAELDSAEAFFRFFAVPYEPQHLQYCSLPVLSDFHRRLRGAVPLRNLLDDGTQDNWHLARRLLVESYRSQMGEEGL